MNFMMAFGWASIMLCLGVFLRAKVPFLRNILAPASVVGGVLGFILVNVCSGLNLNLGTDTEMYTSIVNNLFTISFISISLTKPASKEKNNSKNFLQGMVALGLIWCFLYALPPIIATGLIKILGKDQNMDAIYGMLIPFAFCQGPGQAAAYGEIFEQYGWEKASVVAITFATIGFVAAFAVGIPVAKAGIKKGIVRHCKKIDDRILKGYLKKEEQTEYMVRDTNCNSNVETLAFHFALIGGCYILAVGISKILSFIPGFLGTSMSSMMFMNGMYAAYIVRWLMGKLNIDFLQDNVLQSKITGWTSDYLVVCSFMAISINLVSQWVVPILTVSLAVTIVTFLVCFYLGARIGGDNDFERTLGLYGICTGTVPSGISLIRIVDLDFETATSAEIGACNTVMLASTPVYIIILAVASGSLPMNYAIMCLIICAGIYLGVLKVARLWGQKTYDWK